MKTLVTSFLLPPGLFIVLAILALVWFKKRPRAAHGVLLVACVSGWLFSSTAFGKVLSSFLIGQVNSRQDITPQDVDMLVVLTGGIQYTGPTGWVPRNESFRRGTAAFDLQRYLGGRVPILFSGGKTEGVQAPSEADVLRRQFDKDNAQITPVLVEEGSTNTYESALQCAGILQQRGSKGIILVTSEVHMLRALAVFRGRGIDPLPFPVFTLARRDLSFQDFLPSVEGVRDNFTALYEIVGLVQYLVTGRVGWSDVFYKPNTDPTMQAKSVGETWGGMDGQGSSVSAGVGVVPSTAGEVQNGEASLQIGAPKAAPSVPADGHETPIGVIPPPTVR